MADFNDVYRGGYKEGSYYGDPSSVLRKHIDLVQPASPRALDLGCGDGRNAFFLAKKGFFVNAIDLSPEAIKKIVNQSDKHNLLIETCLGDILGVTYEEDAFDLVVASTILDHLHRSDALEMVQKIIKWTKPSGFIYIGVFTVEDQAFIGSKETNISETGEHLRTFFELGELKKLFRGHKIIYYDERVKLDRSHGLAHYHGLARIFVQGI